MIVKRLMESVRRQDWAAVTIEFVLVVVGVLLAFQINEWATVRQSLALREAATFRLLDEAEQDVAYLKRAVEQRQLLVGNLSYALDRLQKKQWQTADRARMVSGLTNSVYLSSPTPPSSVYQDIVAAGMLGEIGDPKLRSAVGNYQAQLTLLSKLIDYIRQIAPQLDRERSVHYVYDAGGERPSRLDVDFDALDEDVQLQSRLALLNDRQAFILKTWRGTLGAAEVMCRELGRSVDRPCNLNRSPLKFN